MEHLHYEVLGTLYPSWAEILQCWEPGAKNKFSGIQGVFDKYRYFCNSSYHTWQEKEEKLGEKPMKIAELVWPERSWSTRLRDSGWTSPPIP